MCFSAKDNDQDAYGGGDCASALGAPFWHNNCHDCNPLGIYGDTTKGKGVNWNNFQGPYVSLDTLIFKIKIKRCIQGSGQSCTKCESNYELCIDTQTGKLFCGQNCKSCKSDQVLLNDTKCIEEYQCKRLINNRQKIHQSCIECHSTCKYGCNGPNQQDCYFKSCYDLYKQKPSNKNMANYLKIREDEDPILVNCGDEGWEIPFTNQQYVYIPDLYSSILYKWSIGNIGPYYWHKLTNAIEQREMRISIKEKVTNNDYFDIYIGITFGNQISGFQINFVNRGLHSPELASYNLASVRSNKFSTKDNDQDPNLSQNCAQIHSRSGYFSSTCDSVFCFAQIANSIYGPITQIQKISMQLRETNCAKRDTQSTGDCVACRIGYVRTSSGQCYQCNKSCRIQCKAGQNLFSTVGILQPCLLDNTCQINNFPLAQCSNCEQNCGSCLIDQPQICVDCLDGYVLDTNDGKCKCDSICITCVTTFYNCLIFSPSKQSQIDRIQTISREKITPSTINQYNKLLTNSLDIIDTSNKTSDSEDLINLSIQRISSIVEIMKSKQNAVTTAQSFNKLIQVTFQEKNKQLLEAKETFRQKLFEIESEILFKNQTNALQFNYFTKKQQTTDITFKTKNSQSQIATSIQFSQDILPQSLKYNKIYCEVAQQQPFNVINFKDLNQTISFPVVSVKFDNPQIKYGTKLLNPIIVEYKLLQSQRLLYENRNLESKFRCYSVNPETNQIEELLFQSQFDQDSDILTCKLHQVGSISAFLEIVEETIQELHVQLNPNFNKNPKKFFSMISCVVYILLLPGLIIFGSYLFQEFKKRQLRKRNNDQTRNNQAPSMTQDPIQDNQSIDNNEKFQQYSDPDQNSIQVNLNKKSEQQKQFQKNNQNGNKFIFSIRDKNQKCQLKGYQENGKSRNDFKVGVKQESKGSYQKYEIQPQEKNSHDDNSDSLQDDIDVSKSQLLGSNQYEQQKKSQNQSQQEYHIQQKQNFANNEHDTGIQQQKSQTQQQLQTCLCCCNKILCKKQKGKIKFCDQFVSQLYSTSTLFSLRKDNKIEIMKFILRLLIKFFMLYLFIPKEHKNLELNSSDTLTYISSKMIYSFIAFFLEKISYGVQWIFFKILGKKCQIIGTILLQVLIFLFALLIIYKDQQANTIQELIWLFNFLISVFILQIAFFDLFLHLLTSACLKDKNAKRCISCKNCGICLFSLKRIFQIDFNWWEKAKNNPIPRIKPQTEFIEEQ